MLNIAFTFIIQVHKHTLSLSLSLTGAEVFLVFGYISITIITPSHEILQQNKKHKCETGVLNQKRYFIIYKFKVLLVLEKIFPLSQVLLLIFFFSFTSPR